MRAADAAVAFAQKSGWSVEQIIAFDNPSPRARAMFQQPALDHWTRIDVDGGDLGPTRNKVVREHAQGRAIAFLDADDLFSENWLAQGMARLQAAIDAGCPKSIIHPELNWLFDGARSVYWNPDQTDPMFAPQYFYLMNYYDSLCLAPREAHLDIPYATRALEQGLSFQDWHFAIETMSAGWRHMSAADTIIFKRRRDDSLVTQSRATEALVRALPAMRVDRVSTLGKVASGMDAGSGGACVPSADMTIDPAAKLLELNARAQRETPWYGAGMQARVARANARRRPEGEDPTYDLMHQHFDMPYYMASNPDLAEAERIDPVDHYIRVGAKEGRSPTPLFQTAAYIAKHPEPPPPEEGAVAAPQPAFAKWLDTYRAQGRSGAVFEGMGVLAPLLGMTEVELQQAWTARYIDLRARLMFGELGAQVAKAAAFDPLVSEIWPEALQIKIPILHSGPTIARLAALTGALNAAGNRPYRAVILVNRPRWGGARRMEGHIADALVARFGADQVLVISTDKTGKMPKGKFPEGVTQIDFADLAQNLRPQFRRRVLTETLRAFAPEVAINVNSRLFWEVLDSHGKGLSASIDIYGCLLCNEQNRFGHWNGYPLRRFYRSFDILSGVFTDSSFLAEELLDHYMVPPAERGKVQALHGPVDLSIPLARVPDPQETPDAPRRPQVFWAGRLDPQKRVELAYAVAALMPEIDLRMWGEAVNGNPHRLPPKPGNVILEGQYAQFSDLPLHEADAWLYTSAWDGVPQILLEVAMAGLPVVASDVGGTREALAQSAIPILPDAPAQTYADALRALLADPAAARHAAAAHRETLIAARTPLRYRADFEQLLERDKDI